MTAAVATTQAIRVSPTLALDAVPSHTFRRLVSATQASLHQPVSMAAGDYSSGGSGGGYNTGNQGQPNFGTGSGSGHHSGTGSGSGHHSGTGSGSGHHSGTGSGSGHHSGTGSHLTGITGSGYGPSDGTQAAGRGSDGAFATGTGKGLNQGKANCLQCNRSQQNFVAVTL